MHRRLMCAPMIILFLLLSACGAASRSRSRAEQLALDIRTEFLETVSCSGTVEMVADYGERVYNYTLTFQWKQGDDLTVSVQEPEDAAGITARIRDGNTFLEYDGIRMETGELDTGGLTPIDALPVILRALREEFIAECGMVSWTDDTDVLRLCCRPPENEAGVGREITLWLDPENHMLLHGEVACDGITVIQCRFKNFTAG